MQELCTSGATYSCRCVQYGFVCVQIMILLSTLRIVNIRTDVDAYDCTRGLYRYGKRVCTENWRWETNPLRTWNSNLRQYFRQAFQPDALQAVLFPAPNTGRTFRLYGWWGSSEYVTRCFTPIQPVRLYQGEEVRPNLTSNGSCVSISIRLQWLRASVLTCPFQIQHAIFHKRLTAPASQWAPVVWTWEKEKPEVTTCGNSRVAARLNTSTFPLLWLGGFGCIVWQPVPLRWKCPTVWGSNSPLNHTAETSRVSAP